MEQYFTSPTAQGSQNLGGGYMSPGPGMDASPGQASRTTNQQTMTPLTAKQVSTLSVSQTDDSVMLDEKELNQVTVVGRIVELNEPSNQLKFTLNDTTGVVDVVYWNDSDPIQLQKIKDVMKVGNFVRIMGSIKTYNGRKTLQAYRMLPIVNLNELDFHFLEIVRNHLRNIHGDIVPPVGGNTETDVTMMNNTLGIQLNPLQQEIINIIKEDTSKYGLTAVDIKRISKQNATVSGIEEAIKLLSEEGYLYSTSDESHFKATDI